VDCERGGKGAEGKDGEEWMGKGKSVIYSLEINRRSAIFFCESVRLIPHDVGCRGNSKEGVASDRRPPPANDLYHAYS